MYIRPVSLAAIAAAIAAVPAHAQDDIATGAAATAAAADAVNGAADIIVTGRAQKLYRVDEIVTGKLPTDPLASSQTITVITEQLIEDQGARDAQDLYRNISGVSFFSYAGVTARGFRQEEIFYDGLRGDPYAGFSVPQLFNIERVEFLKGPAGMLYGPGAPGGLFNYVTKKPEDSFSAEVSTVVGTGDRYGGSAEVTGPLVGALTGRAGLFYEDRDTYRFNAGSETLIADGGLAYDFGPAKVILQATRYDQELDANRLRGVPTDDEGNFLASRRWNHNEPTDFLNLRSDVVQARIEADPSDSLSFDATLRYNDALEEQQYHEPRGLFDSDGDGEIDATIREFRDQVRMQETWSFGTNAIWSADFGPVSNRILVGYDRFTGDSFFKGRSLRGTTEVTPGLPSPLSLIDPQYGLSDSSTYDQIPFRITDTEQSRQGVYLLEEATIGPVVAVGGIRYDRFNDVEGETEFKDSEVTWRAGLVYRAREDLSFFGQYATSFEPQGISAQSELAGGPFAPTTGDIFEGGVKTDLFSGKVQSTLSAYRIRRRNILQTDPRGDVGGDGIDDLIAFGEITSKGIDFDLAADLTRNWVLTLAYAYNDTRITEDNGEGGGFANNVGDRFANAPEHKLGFWTRYQFPELGLALALGGDYVSERLSIDGQRVKPYMIFDASIIYETGPWRALLRADNIFDKTYAASGFIARTGHFPGEPRSVFLEVSRRW
ncbi:TonB-dependent siderophore receptor [Sphingosinicella humi]|uniref:TonB-dependent siderophore receptor n=1 Tax=Allosphingosinicella humi TaxID=2068657 RepID=A0A2U2J369_9SPHN|nr:TonB-dependent siderophore receptor [Sphingosinicella humi]PWG02777.1 TonB-dependent siderophore receptor [Sphingosinicella humi]